MTTYSGWHFLSDPTQLSNDGGPLLPVVELPKGIHPELCSTGFHASRRPLDALSFAPGPWLCRVRLEGEVILEDDKAVGSRRVLLAGPVDLTRELRLFACDCAERVLPIFERERPGDARPRAAIETARRYANGEATRNEMAAARDAAWDWQNRRLAKMFRAATAAKENA